MRSRFPASAGVAAALALVLIAAAPQVVAAQTFADQAWKQLQAAYTKVKDQGYGADNYVVGKLDDDGQETWTFQFSAGRTYLLAGVCDNDCHDLDIVLLDDSGNVLKRDASTDDVPVVSYSPQTTGRFRVRVVMYTCNANPCYFGFGIFSK